MSLEILLAIYGNIHPIFRVFCVAAGAGILCSVIGVFVSNGALISSTKDSLSYKEWKLFNALWKRVLKIASVTFLITIAPAILPSLNQLWKVRISLIKLELSSETNIKKSVETIERIGKKLECKYLGCKKESGSN